MNLKDRLVEMIETGGPLPVSVYMQLCLHDPQFGYYANHPGLGTDFITAPEISQVFGELLGLWTAHCLLYTSPSPRDATLSRMPSSA